MEIFQFWFPQYVSNVTVRQSLRVGMVPDPWSPCRAAALCKAETPVTESWSKWLILLVMGEPEAQLCPTFSCGFLGVSICQHLYPAFYVPICHPFPSFVIKYIH